MMGETNIQINKHVIKLQVVESVMKEIDVIYAREWWLAGKWWGNQIYVAGTGLPETWSETRMMRKSKLYSNRPGMETIFL